MTSADPTREPIVEVTVPYAVPDITDLVISVATE